ncbi:transporter substrate-binding domain-containing protein [Saccharothrix sp. NRRL B-16314]|uniref:transporter substrate-binding domain-containing protein n=1 Tax=Saccharothrix sp. NRRL B-16314 TaxID=1463825 RepID=UPI000527BCFF|nr:transporter substrate-binding domain-containing protein [Saccharothrix sp. NRRL B-16314]
MIRRRLIPLIIAMLTTAALTAAAYVHFDTPTKYLGDELVVGISGTMPGWSFPDDAPEGFDIDLATFIATELGFDHVTYQVLQPVERITALTEGRVDLVIANFSIDGPSWPDQDKRRRNLIDFAGPYYIDNSGLMYSADKMDRLDPGWSGIPRELVCTNAGTTAEHNTLREHDRDCFNRFVDPDDLSVVAVVTDQSLLVAYSKARRSAVLPLMWENDPSTFPVKDERYGVGMRKGTPGLCQQLNDLVQRFLDERWDGSFARWLGTVPHGKSHKVSDVDRTLCGN